MAILYALLDVILTLLIATISTLYDYIVIHLMQQGSIPVSSQSYNI